MMIYYEWLFATMTVTIIMNLANDYYPWSYNNQFFQPKICQSILSSHMPQDYKESNKCYCSTTPVSDGRLVKEFGIVSTVSSACTAFASKRNLKYCPRIQNIFGKPARTDTNRNRDEMDGRSSLLDKILDSWQHSAGDHCWWIHYLMFPSAALIMIQCSDDTGRYYISDSVSESGAAFIFFSDSIHPPKICQIMLSSHILHMNDYYHPWLFAIIMNHSYPLLHPIQAASHDLPRFRLEALVAEVLDDCWNQA